VEPSEFVLTHFLFAPYEYVHMQAGSKEEFGGSFPPIFLCFPNFVLNI